MYLSKCLLVCVSICKKIHSAYRFAISICILGIEDIYSKHFKTARSNADCGDTLRWRQLLHLQLSWLWRPRWKILHTFLYNLFLSVSPLHLICWKSTTPRIRKTNKFQLANCRHVSFPILQGKSWQIMAWDATHWPIPCFRCACADDNFIEGIDA